MARQDKDHGTLGDTIRQAREELGLSIRELARVAGVNFAYLSRLETNERGASADVLQRLADVLKLEASDLLRFIGVRPELPEPRMYFRRKLGVDDAEADIL